MNLNNYEIPGAISLVAMSTLLYNPQWMPYVALVICGAFAVTIGVLVLRYLMHKPSDENEQQSE